MIYTQEGSPTKLQSGDAIEFDVNNQMVRLLRDGQLLRNDTGDSTYWIMPQDGVQLGLIAVLLADASGLRVEPFAVLRGNPIYRFK